MKTFYNAKFTKMGSGESFSSITGSGSASSTSGSHTGTFSTGFGMILAVTFPGAEVFASCGRNGENRTFSQGCQLEDWLFQYDWAKKIVTFFRGMLACTCSLTLLPMSPRAVLGLSPGLDAAANATGTRLAPAMLTLALFSVLIFEFWIKRKKKQPTT